MAVDNVRPEFRDQTGEAKTKFWIGKRRRVWTLLLAEQYGRPLKRALQAVNSDSIQDFEGIPVRMRHGRDSDIVTALDQSFAQRDDVPFLAADDGRIKLCEH
jgi:hypothetical protein